MKNGLLASLAFLTITSLFVCRLSLSASSPVDSLAAEAAARKADADWAAAASTPSVDAWMSFYAADAIVLLPNDQLASGKELVRQTVTRLLALPHLSVAWRPIEVKVPRSGDLAFLIAAYELRFDDSHGAPVADRGRRLEIWRKQAGGTWKCIVDTWNLDAPIEALSASSPASCESFVLIVALTVQPYSRFSRINKPPVTSVVYPCCGWVISRYWTDSGCFRCSK